LVFWQPARAYHLNIVISEFFFSQNLVISCIFSQKS
jgi:hypothetical protein